MSDMKWVIILGLLLLIAYVLEGWVVYQILLRKLTRKQMKMILKFWLFIADNLLQRKNLVKLGRRIAFTQSWSVYRRDQD